MSGKRAILPGNPMNLGFFTMPIHPLDKDWRTSLREDREAFILADKLGDHYFNSVAPGESDGSSTS